MIKRIGQAKQRVQFQRSSRHTLLASTIVASAIVLLASVSVAAVGASGGFSTPTAATTSLAGGLSPTTSQVRRSFRRQAEQ